MKIELVKRNGQYFIRKRWGIFTVWWHNNWWIDNGWELFRYPMSKDEAEETFARLHRKEIEKAKFKADTDKVIQSI